MKIESIIFWIFVFALIICTIFGLFIWFDILYIPISLDGVKILISFVVIYAVISGLFFGYALRDLLSERREK